MEQKPQITENRIAIFSNPHFWAILIIYLLILLIYSNWPWRVWDYSSGFWRWLSWLSYLGNLAIFEYSGRIVGSLFLIPVLYACFMLPWPGTMAISMLSIGGILPIIWGMWSANPLSVIINITLLLVPFVLTSLVVFELEKRRREARFLATQEQERKMYIAKIIEAQENESKRIAQDLHDDTMQTLFFIGHYADSLASNLNDPNIVFEKANRIRDIALNATTDLRGICLNLRPSILDDYGLIPALRWLVDNLNKDCNIHTQIIIEGTQRRLSPFSETTVFRIMQEALNNIKNHSKANNALVNVEFNSECLKLIIKDDGQGFEKPNRLEEFAIQGKLGLIGMQQRVLSTNGKMQIVSRPGQGTLLSIEVK